MKKIFIFLAGLGILASCNNANSNSQPENSDNDTAATASAKNMEQAPISLQKVWETDTSLNTCESVLYDKDENVLFVSCINGKPAEKNGKGFIAKVNMDGSIKKLKWAEGLNAPKGMGISHGKLYVTDIDELVSIDLATGKILDHMPPDHKAKFLNDVAVDENSVIYFSGTQKGFIYQFKPGGGIVTKGQALNGVNGLTFYDNKMFGVDNEGIRHYSLSNPAVLINDQVKGGDGIVALNDSTFIATKWDGEIYYTVNNKAWKILDTRNQKMNSADICYLPDKKLLLVPTFYGNKVVAYKVNR